jgi:AraC-like DNA-binding protein
MSRRNQALSEQTLSADGDNDLDLPSRSKKRHGASDGVTMATVADNAWATVRTSSEVADFRTKLTESSPYWWPDIYPLRDASSLSFAHRMGRIGPLTILDSDFHDDAWVNGGDRRPHYHVTLPAPAPAATSHSDFSGVAASGSFAVYLPTDKGRAHRPVGRRLALMIDRHAIEDALADALGRPVTSPIDFHSRMPTETEGVRSWITMVSLFTQQLFEPGSVVHQPMVGLPFADSVVRGFLFAADHSLRAMLEAGAIEPPSRAIRGALDVIEAEAHRPLTVSELAAHSYVSVRSLQLGFRAHVGMTPMAYLREVRLRRARQDLLESDTSTDTVASIAFRWGFTNLGRFAARYATRYHEKPAVTLSRR